MRFLYLIFLIGFIFMSYPKAAVFNVSSYLELVGALSIVSNNGEDDIINVAKGNYVIKSPLIYKPKENKALIIQGAGADVTIFDGANLSRILIVDTTHLKDDSEAHITINGITFSNGNSSEIGGAVLITTKLANITVENCKFYNNSAESGGGLFIRTLAGSIAVKGNSFMENTSNGGGGAWIEADGGNIVLEGNTFEGNTANGGGGALIWGMRVVMEGNKFSNNVANDIGGTALIYGDDVTMAKNVFISDSTTTNGSAFIWGGLLSMSGNSFFSSSNGNVAWSCVVRSD